MPLKSKPPTPARGGAGAAAATLGTFLMGQGLVQVLTLATGLVLVRWMAVEEFAMYRSAFAFQFIMGALVDLGLSGSIVAMIGRDRDDPGVVGGFIHAAKRYRDRLFVVMLAVYAVVFPLMTLQHGWGWSNQLILFVCVAAFTYCQGYKMYGAALLVHGRLRGFYAAQLAHAGVKLAVIVALHGLGWLTATAALGLAAATVLLEGVLLHRQARRYLQEPTHADADKSRALLRVVRPLMPLIAFGAFQSQVAVLVAMAVGANRTIAEVGALDKVWGLFVVLDAATSVVFAPMIAKLPAARLPGRYAGVLLLGAILGAGVTCGVFLFPAPVMWLLGPQYAGLGYEAGLMTAAASLTFLSRMAAGLNQARRFTSWWATATLVAGTLATQAAAALVLDVSTLRGVILFLAAGNAAMLAAHMGNAAVSLARGGATRGEGVGDVV